MRKSFFLSVLALALCQTSCAQWSTPEEVSALKEHFMMGASAYEGGLLVLVRDEQYERRIMLAERHDGVWSNPQPLSFVPDSSRDVSLFVSSAGVVYVAWYRRSHDLAIGQFETDEVWVARRVGSEWEAPHRLYGEEPGGFNNPYPVSFVEMPDGSVHAVFAARPGNKSSALHSRYDDVGWTVPDTLCQFCGQPDLAVDRAGRLVVTYIAGASLHGEYDANSIFFIASKPDGGWEAPVLVSRSGRERGQDPTILAVPDGRLLLVWRKETLGSTSSFNYTRIWISESSDGGHTWAEPYEIQGDAGGFFLNFGAAVDGEGTLHLVAGWTSSDYYTGRLYAYEWNDRSLRGPLRLSPSETAGFNALTVLPSGHLQFFWTERLSCNAAHTYCVFRMMEMSRPVTTTDTEQPIQPGTSAAISLPFPNPATSTTRFTVSLESARRATLAITDVLGRLVQRTALTTGTSQVVEVNVAGLSAGVYLARLVTDAGSITQRFVVSH